jgi:hypothetical protein
MRFRGIVAGVESKRDLRRRFVQLVPAGGANNAIYPLPRTRRSKLTLNRIRRGF